MEFEAFFERYVVNMMLADVGREIAAAQRDENSGDFLCALGLLSYTEVMGRYVSGVQKGSRNRFEAFFRRLGLATRTSWIQARTSTTSTATGSSTPI